MLAALLTAVVLPLSAAAETRIVYPPDNALLTGDGSIEVLGVRQTADPPTITVVGKDGTQTLSPPAGVFRLKAKLNPGVNVLTAGEKKLKVFLAGADAGAPAEVFSPPDTHAVDNACADCHAVAGAEVKLSAKVPALCLGCHDDMTKAKDGKKQPVAHPPVDEGDCLACHAFHRLKISKLPPGARRQICFGCHDDFTAGGKERMHAPVARGECTGCHLVHGAPGKKLLPATGVKLCVLCHKDPSRTADGKAWTVSHPALDDGCPTCHLPHVSKSKGLLKKPQAQLCFDCHDNPAPEGSKLKRHPPFEDGECAGCHRPHGSSVKKLLAAEGKALCEPCHGDPTKGADGKPLAVQHPALDDGCPTCHLPHASENDRLLKKPQAPLCFDCHDAFGKGADGKPLLLHRPVAQGQCAGCHAPHGSANKKLLAASPARALCLKCHKDPTLGPDGAPWKVQHPAVDDGCPTCHLPHASANPKLLPKPQPELCAGCHENKNLNGNGTEWATPHPPVRAGMCVSCHAPHGAPEKALLPRVVNELCQNCHKELHVNHLSVELDPATGQPVSGKATLPPNFPVRKKDGALACIGCHQTHGSDNPKLWNREEDQFCNTCHTKY
jgi:predicted CXXCH cytochrome family protein